MSRSVCLAGADPVATASIAAALGSELGDRAGRLPRRPDVEAVILATPTPLHAAQAIECLEAGKAGRGRDPDGGQSCRRRTTRRSRRAAPALSRWLDTHAGSIPRTFGSTREIRSAARSCCISLTLRPISCAGQHQRSRPAAQLDRSPAVAPRRPHGRPLPLPDRRNTGSRGRSRANRHPRLGIAMDMSIQLKSHRARSAHFRCRSTTMVRLGSTFRYICDRGTYRRAIRRSVRRLGHADRLSRSQRQGWRPAAGSGLSSPPFASGREPRSS